MPDSQTATRPASDLILATLGAVAAAGVAAPLLMLAPPFVAILAYASVAIAWLCLPALQGRPVSNWCAAPFGVIGAIGYGLAIDISGEPVTPSVVIGSLIGAGALLGGRAGRLGRSRDFLPWQCPRCRYDLRGLDAESPCPECGAPRA